MNQILISYLSQISNFIGYHLDKLKVSNPLLYSVVQLICGGLLVGFSLNFINLREDIDSYIIVILTALNIGVSPRTTQAKINYENASNPNMLKPSDKLQQPVTEQPTDEGQPVS